MTVYNGSGHPYGQLHGPGGNGAGEWVAYWADPKLQADLSKSISINNPTIRWFVQLSTGSINESQMDWSQWATSLTGKADTDANNLTQTGKANIVALGMPDYKNVQKFQNNVQFTAPFDGIVVYDVIAQQGGTGSNSTVSLFDSEGNAIFTLYQGQEYTSGANPMLKNSGIVFVPKGYSVKIFNKVTESTNIFNYYPLKGAV